MKKHSEIRLILVSCIHADSIKKPSLDLSIRVEEKGIALITGEIGTGKTTVSRALIDSLDKQYKPVLFLNPRFAPAQFLRTLAHKLNLKPKHVKSEVVEQIHDKLYEYYESSTIPSSYN